MFNNYAIVIYIKVYGCLCECVCVRERAGTEVDFEVEFIFGCKGAN